MVLGVQVVLGGTRGIGGTRSTGVQIVLRVQGVQKVQILLLGYFLKIKGNSLSNVRKFPLKSKGNSL